MLSIVLGVVVVVVHVVVVLLLCLSPLVRYWFWSREEGKNLTAEQKRHELRFHLLMSFGIAVFLVVVFGLIFLGTSDERSIRSRFDQAVLEEYLSMAKLDNNVGGGGKGSIKGKAAIIALVESEEGKQHVELHKCHFDSSLEDLRASGPEEVGTVIVVREKTKQVATYTSGSPGFAAVWEVSIIDTRRRVVTEHRSFEGGDPPQSVRAGMSGYGPPPKEKVKQYLKSLPLEAIRD